MNLRGQSFLEVILALAIFAIMAATLTSMLTGGFGLVQRSSDQMQAEGYAQQGIEIARALHQDAWNTIPYTSSTTEIIGKFTRITEYTALCRDTTHSLASCPASYTDVQSKQASVSVRWEVRPGVMNSVNRITYITNWNSRDWQQTDWSGGGNQSIWSDATRYDTAIALNATSAPGSIRLADAPDGQWSLSGGGEFTDTADTDFAFGAMSNTVVQGAGEAADVRLEQGIQWASHRDSSSSTTRDINAFSALSPTNIWAAADNGEILRYTGNAWSIYIDVGSPHLRGITMRTTSDGWTAGQTGKIYHYDGTSWSEHTDTGDHVWRDVIALSSTDVWVVGSDDEDDEDSNGRIAHYDGTSWVVTSPPSSRSIRAVAALSASDIWAVGRSGRIWHYDGSSWSLQTDTGDEVWQDINMLSSTDGWAVGDNGALAHWNGTQWSESIITSSEDIRGIYALSASDIWAAGKSGRIWHYNGTSWSLTADLGDQTWNDIILTGIQEGWVGGGAGKIGAYGNFYDPSGTFLSRVFDSGNTATIWSIATWIENLSSGSDITFATRSGNTATPDGTWSSWSSELTNALGSTITSPSRRYVQYRLTLTRGSVPTDSPSANAVTIIYNLATIENLRGVWAVSSTDVWGVGVNGKIIRYNNSIWSEHTDTGSETWNDIAMTSATSGWAVGNSGSLAQWNGTQWSESSVPSSADIFAITSLTTSDIWASGSNGRIWHYDGSAWSLHTDTGDEVWNDIVMTSAANGWAVGNAGKLAQWNGSVWTESTIPSSADIRSVYALSSTDIWAVGTFGHIWHYDGSAWSLYTDTGDETWNTIVFSTSYNGWIGSSLGSIRRWDGSAWNLFTSPTSQSLNDITLVNEKLGWAVGNAGTVLRFFREAVYQTSGSLISSAFFLSNPSPIQAIEWINTGTSCTEPCVLRFQLRAAPDTSGSPGTWTSWYGTSGEGSYFTVADGTLVSSVLNGYQWVQYRAEFSSDGTSTPVLTDVKVNYR